MPVLSDIRMPRSPAIQDSAFQIPGTTLTENEGRVWAAGLEVYLDESAGDHSSDPVLRRAGWGLALLDPTKDKESQLEMQAAFFGCLGEKNRHKTQPQLRP